jgi:4-hydroxy-4-methyl-2-oxoglutarate aldolase
MDMDDSENTAIVNMEDVCARYRRLYSGVVYDVLESLGYPNQVLMHDLRPLSPEMRLAGPAFTIKGTMTCERDTAGRHKRIAMIKQMTHPCVEVRDRGTPFNVALYGELSANAALAQGAVGALIDGATRDSGHLIAMKFPVFARFRNPVESFGRYMMLSCQVPILLSGETMETVRVDPGDFIFGEADGALVIPKHLTLKVLAECERIIGIEDKARVEFARGDDPVEVFQRHQRL